MPDRLDREDRLRLMKFVCSFAWADLEIQDAEREFVKKLVRSLELDEEETALVEQWLEVPPPAEELDPAQVPRGHREMFLRAARAMVASDGQIDENEAENLELLEALLR
ncbi:MAG: TerB family tellurite resistance protein [Myxococcota bacterium]